VVTSLPVFHIWISCILPRAFVTRCNKGNASDGSGIPSVGRGWCLQERLATLIRPTFYDATPTAYHFPLSKTTNKVNSPA
jgi:hypothetical protein